MTLKRLAAKINPTNAHLITLSDEESAEQCYLRPQKRVLKILRDNHVLYQLSVIPKANVSSQLNFRLFVSSQLTPSRSSSLSVPESTYGRVEPQLL